MSVRSEGFVTNLNFQFSHLKTLRKRSLCKFISQREPTFKAAPSFLHYAIISRYLGITRYIPVPRDDGLENNEHLVMVYR